MAALRLAAHTATLLLDVMDDKVDIDRTSSATWCLLSTNAHFTPGGQRNHWMPAFFQEPISEKAYDELVSKAIIENKSKCSRLETTLAQLREKIKVETDRAQSAILKISLDNYTVDLTSLLFWFRAHSFYQLLMLYICLV